MARSRKLDRLLRVRTLQLDQVRAAEVQAQHKVAQELQLRARIAALADEVAPSVAAPHWSGTGMRAAAHYRERLHQSADAAERRVTAAEHGLDHARAVTREARRDQSAIEKLLTREAQAAARKALRELEALPPAGRKRHDLC